MLYYQFIMYSRTYQTRAERRSPRKRVFYPNQSRDTPCAMLARSLIPKCSTVYKYELSLVHRSDRCRATATSTTVAISIGRAKALICHCFGCSWRRLIYWWWNLGIAISRWRWRIAFHPVAWSIRVLWICVSRLLRVIELSSHHPPMIRERC